MTNEHNQSGQKNPQQDQQKPGQQSGQQQRQQDPQKSGQQSGQQDKDQKNPNR
jgi:hypothetical protein